MVVFVLSFKASTYLLTFKLWYVEVCCNKEGMQGDFKFIMCVFSESVLLTSCFFMHSVSLSWEILKIELLGADKYLYYATTVKKILFWSTFSPLWKLLLLLNNICSWDTQHLLAFSPLFFSFWYQLYWIINKATNKLKSQLCWREIQFAMPSQKTACITHTSGPDPFTC